MILRRKHHFVGVSLAVSSSVLAWNDFADVEVFEGRCPLVCSNGSVCRKGNATTSALTTNFPWLVSSSSSATQYFCQCRDGYTGSDCSVPYEACHDVENDSNRGLHSRAKPFIAACFNGGRCSSDGGRSSAACNCSSAVSSNGTRFVGRNCEVPMPREYNNCSEGHQPCLNGGKCLMDNRCDCPSGFQGVQCETADPEALSDCTLPCQNNGVCVNEIAPERNESTDVVVAMALWDVPSIDGMRCECPDGYQGVLCQYQVEVCGQGEHLCLHGSRCVQENDNGSGGGASSGSYRCECDNADDRACLKQVDWCWPSSNNYPSHPEFFESSAAPAFCVNGGRCRDIQWGDYLQFGCECPTLFHGPHCELVKNGMEVLVDLRVADAMRTGTNNLRHYGFLSLYIFLAAMVLTAFVFWGRSRWRVRRGWGLWRRHRPPTTEEYNKNLYSFRDENGGGGAVTTANGNLFFPTSYGGGSAALFATGGDHPHDDDDDNNNDDELLVLHDVEIM